jgi:hypothetical protein
VKLHCPSRARQEVASRLAEQILQFRQLHPDCPIFLVGHCSGSFVTLQAAEHWTGHQGGHFDAYHKPFLRNFVLNMCRRYQSDGTQPKRGLPALFTASKPVEPPVNE